MISNAGEHQKQVWLRQPDRIFKTEHSKVFKQLNSSRNPFLSSPVFAPRIEKQKQNNFHCLVLPCSRHSTKNVISFNREFNPDK